VHDPLTRPTQRTHRCTICFSPPIFMQHCVPHRKDTRMRAKPLGAKVPGGSASSPTPNDPSPLTVAAVQGSPLPLPSPSPLFSPQPPLRPSHCAHCRRWSVSRSVAFRGTHPEDVLGSAVFHDTANFMIRKSIFVMESKHMN